MIELGERERAAAMGAGVVLALAACGGAAIFLEWALRATRAAVLGWVR